MSIWKTPARLAAPLVFVAAGLVIGLAVGGGQTANGTEPQQATNAAVDSTDSRLADMVPQAAFVEVAHSVGPTVVFIEAIRAQNPAHGADQGQGQNDRFQEFFDARMTVKTATTSTSRTRRAAKGPECSSAPTATS